MPLSWHVAGWQEDIVQPIASSNSELEAARDKQRPDFAFQTLTSSIPGHFWVRYLRNGEEHYLNSADHPGAELLRPPPWILGKWLVFRPVDAVGPMQCRH
jgi:hypothetical protein